MSKSKKELIYDIENELVDPTTNKITGDRVKARLLDMVETMAESAGSGGSSTMEYWKINELTADQDLIVHLSSISKVDDGYSVMIIPTAYASLIQLFPTAIAIDMNMRMCLPGADATVGELIAEEYGDISQLTGFTQITEEEFYNTTIA